MGDDDERPKLTVVADSPKPKREERFARQSFNSALLQLAANIIRVVRGAGRPEEIILQCDDVVRTAVEFRDVAERVPLSHDVASLLRLRDEDTTGYEDLWIDREDARQDMIRGALQLVASKLLSQPLQIQQGKKQMHDAYLRLKRISDEIRRQSEERLAARSRAAPKSKPAKRKPRKPKDEGYL
ncbi:hypothetical protein [Sinorhizobium fredii]|uniref:hypothetical protein n=1 Tax=Rhizobium fredii TaxID=380 RepID=UPI00055F308E|nr:hypothetical protein [Sinorhizobium fredii]